MPHDVQKLDYFEYITFVFTFKTMCKIKVFSTETCVSFYHVRSCCS